MIVAPDAVRVLRPVISRAATQAANGSRRAGIRTAKLNAAPDENKCKC